MSRVSLVAATAIIVVANAIALTQAARNRRAKEAQLTLTERELRYFHNPTVDDESGVTLQLRWTDPSSFPFRGQTENPMIWLDQQKLQGLGFDCSVNPSSPDADRHYQRQRPRPVFVALENDGAAWRAWADAYDRAAAEQRAQTQLAYPLNDVTGFSHLIAIDADLSPANLRARHPDRATVVIVPAVVAVTLQPFPYTRLTDVPDHRARVIGHIQQIPSSVHVPRPFSERFRRMKGGEAYRVHVSYGASLEPWVMGLE